VDIDRNVLGSEVDRLEQLESLEIDLRRLVQDFGEVK
jgi:hypothetical protein